MLQKWFEMISISPIKVDAASETNTLPPHCKNADVGGIGVEFPGPDGVDNGLFGLRRGPEGGKGRWVTLSKSNNRSAILWIKIRYNFAQNSPHGDGGCFVQHLVSPETPSLRCPILHPLPFFLLQIRVLQWSGFQWKREFFVGKVMGWSGVEPVTLVEFCLFLCSLSPCPRVLGKTIVVTIWKCKLMTLELGVGVRRLTRTCEGYWGWWLIRMKTIYSSLT